jgi:predicted ATPase
MNGQLSVGEWICQDFGRYLKCLVAEGRCVFTPYHVDSLDLMNIGRFDEKHLDFADVNIVLGFNGSGMSTIVRAISSVSGSQVSVKGGENRGEINMRLSDGLLLHQDVFDAENVRCVVLDSAGDRLDQERYSEFLSYLRGLNVQLILTVGRTDVCDIISNIFPDCRYIDLNRG